MESLLPVAGFLLVLAAVVTAIRWQHGRARVALGAFAVRRGLYVTDGGSFLGLTFDVRAHGTIEGFAIAVQPVRRGGGRRRRWHTRVSAQLGREARGRVEVRPRDVSRFFRFGAPEVAFGGEFDLRAIVYSKETSLARAWVTNDLQRAFTSFEKDVVLSLEGREVALEWRGHASDVELLERGLALVLVAARSARDAV